MANNNRRRPDYAALYPGLEISDEVLDYLTKSVRKMEYQSYDLKRDRVLQGADGKPVFGENGQPIILEEREVSLEWLMDNNWDFPTDTPDPLDDVIRRMVSHRLNSGLDKLRPNERMLIDALFYSNDGKGMTERKYAAETEKHHMTVHSRKARILGKLKIFLES